MQPPSGSSRNLLEPALTKQEKLLCFDSHPQHSFTAFFNLSCWTMCALACAQGTAPREVRLMTASHGKAYSTRMMLESLRENECKWKTEENGLLIQTHLTISSVQHKMWCFFWKHIGCMWMRTRTVKLQNDKKSTNKVLLILEILVCSSKTISWQFITVGLGVDIYVYNFLKILHFCMMLGNLRETKCKWKTEENGFKMFLVCLYFFHATQNVIFLKKTN